MANELAQIVSVTPQVLAGRVNAIQDAMHTVMQSDIHFGVIPGCGDKPSLFQPGAQILLNMFGLRPDYEVQISSLDSGHREYTSTCTLYSISNGTAVSSGMGSCSTMESKYRYRNVADFEITGDPIPKDAKEKKAEYRRKGYGMKKVDGVWEWVKYTDTQRSENPDIADTYNTVLKMANKRALIAATLNATGASDMFTQDVEDFQRPDYESRPQNIPATTHERDGFNIDSVRKAVREAMNHTGLGGGEITAHIESKLGKKIIEITNECEFERAVGIAKAMRPQTRDLDAGQVQDAEADAYEVENLEELEDIEF